jgi:hypothetical protein
MMWSRLTSAWQLCHQNNQGGCQGGNLRQNPRSCCRQEGVNSSVEPRGLVMAGLGEQEYKGCVWNCIDDCNGGAIFGGKM